MGALRGRLHAAIVAGTALGVGCRGGEPAAAPGDAVDAATAPSSVPPSPATDAASANVPVRVDASDGDASTQVASASSDPEPAPPAGPRPVGPAARRPASSAALANVPYPDPKQTTCAAEMKRSTVCYAPFVGAPKQIIDPHRSFDPSGCTPANEVLDHCNGVYAVLAGPKLAHQECCYTVCQGPVPPCGRPLRDEAGVARVAASRARDDWHGDAEPRPGPAFDAVPLDPADAGAIARAWIADALAEHASIASFARFAIELLAVGAPASFVEDAQRAGLDETAHARLCFEVAREYGGTSVGPDVLPITGVPWRTCLVDVVRAVADEGCCGETFAAALAAEARDGDGVAPGTAVVLARIADDEARHAALAFRFVAWACAGGAPAVVAAAAEGFRAGIARFASELEVSADEARASAEGWRRGGRTTVHARRAVAAAVERDVLVPAMRLALGLRDAPPAAVACAPRPTPRGGAA